MPLSAYHAFAWYIMVATWTWHIMAPRGTIWQMLHMGVLNRVYTILTINLVVQWVPTCTPSKCKRVAAQKKSRSNLQLGCASFGHDITTCVMLPT